MVLTVYGQLILKWRIALTGEKPTNFLDGLKFVLGLFTDIWVLSAFLAAFLAGLCWMAAMVRLEVSHAYPLIVAGLVVLTSISAMLFLGESMHASKIAGIALISFGVVVMLLGAPGEA